MGRAYVFDDADPVPATVRPDGQEPAATQEYDLGPWDDYVIPGGPREDFSIPRSQGTPVGTAVSTANVTAILKEAYEVFVEAELARPAPPSLLPIFSKNIQGRVTFTREQIERTRDAPPGPFWKAAFERTDPDSGALTLEKMREAIDLISAGPPLNQDAYEQRRAQLRTVAADLGYGGTLTPDERVALNLSNMGFKMDPEERLALQTKALKNPSGSAWERFTSALRRK